MVTQLLQGCKLSILLFGAMLKEKVKVLSNGLRGKDHYYYT